MSIFAVRVKKVMSCANRCYGNLDVEMNIYQDEKYVHAAGNYLWLGVLVTTTCLLILKD